jgi:hypothetical protein
MTIYEWIMVAIAIIELIIKISEKNFLGQVIF